MAAPGGFFKERRGLGVPPWVLLLAGLLLALLARPAPGAAQAPDDDWLTLETEHLRVTYPRGAEDLARRAAARGEAAWVRLEALLLEAPDAPVDLLLTDHTDISNGFAQVTPGPRITVFLPPPVDDPGLGYFDEWLELVVTHEVVHVFHLDHAGPLGHLGRAVFGRVPGRWPLFPGFDLPRWAIEGMATWYESRLTESGRVRAAFHDAILRTALLEGRFEDLDQASGESPVWPSGTRSYVYGSRFFDYLLEKHGEDRLADFADAVADQWIPYRLDAAGRDAFGASISDEWEAWTEALRARWAGLEDELARLGPVTRDASLTPGSRLALYPKVGPGGRLAFARADGRTDPQLRVADPRAGEGRELLHTNGLPTFDWLPDGDLVVAQLEARGPWRVYGDLWLVDGADGRARRLTEGARLSHPSAFPDGRAAVAVRSGGGTTALVRVSLEDGAVRPFVPADDTVHWAFPAVSPDGRWVAASRWTPGARLDVVVLGAATGREVARLTDDRAMDLAAAWSPDGRWLVWGSDRTGIPNVLAAPMDPATGRPTGALRLATNVLTAAAYPSVAPASVPGGPWLYWSSYHLEGWEVARTPFRPDDWPEAPAPDPRFAAADPAPPPAPDAGGPPRPYSPLPTLLPTYWEPLYEPAVESRPLRGGGVSVAARDLLGPSVGARSAGRDLVGRHAWDAWLRVHTRGEGRVDGAASWSWAGLGNPVLSAGVDQYWSARSTRLVAPAFPGPLDTLYVLERERSASVAATLRRARYRSDLFLTLSAGVVEEDVELLDTELARTDAYDVLERAATLTDLRATFRWSTVRSYSFQMGGSDGASLYLRGRTRLDPGADEAEGLPGLDRSLDDLLAEVRLFKAVGGPAHAAQVLALRLAGGAARGPGAGAGHFTVGGATGRQEDVTGLSLFGGVPVFFPVRGYGRTERYGRWAWSAAAEYRIPLGIVHQGLGAWPLHLDRVAGTLFADAGNAWGPELDRAGYDNPRRATLASVGAELTADVLALWSEGLLLRTGLAFPLVEGDGVRAYVRLGLPF